MRRLLIPSLLAIAGILAASCGAAPAVPGVAQGRAAPVPTAAVGAVVHLNFESFEPSVVTIHAGQAVEWQWGTPPVPDNVAIAGGATSPPMNSGTWYHTFDRPGVYPYRSDFHQRMRGKVIVLPAQP